MFLTTWWWAAPTAAGLGAIGYAGLTTGRRRSKRLAVDAARHEEREALNRLMQAQADTRSAQAVVLAAKANRGDLRGILDARAALQRAKQAQRAAALALKAARAHVRAERVRAQSVRGDDLPLPRLMREHDALTARWLEYETDVENAIAFPQMSDPHHPVTAAFLRAQQEALQLRPASAGARMRPEEFVAYRAAVRRATEAFETAEDAALRASATRRPVRPAAPPRATPRPSPQARPAEPEPVSEPRREPAAEPHPGAAAETPRPEPVRRAPWPVPRRDPRPPAG